MLLCKNRRLFTVARDKVIRRFSNSHVLTPIPMHLIPIPIPFPCHGWSYSHSHGNPMGPMGSQSSPFPWTPLAAICQKYNILKNAFPITRCESTPTIFLITSYYDHMIRYVGLFGHSAVVFHVFCVFMFLCFTDCLCGYVFFSDILLIYSAV